ncbi:hypothetical protein HGM15179_010597 [Zosterops borbonicus]|uniref:Uncharacterized protein n=1 Tax=Zosterops borbonicus TaxID=364589 RepID=A0A8K1GD73_9PASS|nr:hypothetical protein HGM15179_010597 [Zosterops borbonicus]
MKEEQQASSCCCFTRGLGILKISVGDKEAEQIVAGNRMVKKSSDEMEFSGLPWVHGAKMTSVAQRLEHGQIVDDWGQLPAGESLPHPQFKDCFTLGCPHDTVLHLKGLNSCVDTRISKSQKHDTVTKECSSPPLIRMRKLPYFRGLVPNFQGFALIVASQHLDSGVKTGKEVDEILFVKADGWKKEKYLDLSVAALSCCGAEGFADSDFFPHFWESGHIEHHKLDKRGAEAVCLGKGKQTGKGQKESGGAGPTATSCCFKQDPREANLHPAMCREAAEMLGQRDWGKHEEIPDSLEGRKYEHKKREEEDGLRLLSCTSISISGIILVRKATCINNNSVNKKPICNLDQLSDLIYSTNPKTVAEKHECEEAARGKFLVKTEA